MTEVKHLKPTFFEEYLKQIEKISKAGVLAPCNLFEQNKINRSNLYIRINQQSLEDVARPVGGG